MSEDDRVTFVSPMAASAEVGMRQSGHGHTSSLSTCGNGDTPLAAVALEGDTRVWMEVRSP